MHLIDKHLYPRNFFFAVTKEGIDGRRSLLLEGGHRYRRSSINTSDTRSRSSAQAADAAESQDQASTQTQEGIPARQEDGSQGTEPPPDVDMDDLTGAMSSLRFVPASIRFGRGGRNAGFAKR